MSKDKPKLRVVGGAKKKPAKADAKKKTAAPKAAAAAAPVKHPAKQISQNDLVRLLSRCRSLSTQAAETTGEMGKIVQQAVDGKNLDKKAFSIVRSLDRLSTQKLHSTLPALLLYIDMAGLDKKLADEPQLAMGGAAANGKDEGEDGEDEGKGGDAGEEPAAEGERDLRPAHLRRSSVEPDTSLKH